ncbi:MAG: hypothetical protein ACI9LG_001451 [Moritella dasanensis]|jgi:hypothetical protein
MVLIQVVVKKYRFYNVQQVIQDGFIQYQYDVNNVKDMTINIDLYLEAQNLSQLSESLCSNTKLVVTDTADLLVAISSGFPFHEQEWNRLEALITNSISVLDKKLT